MVVRGFGMGCVNVPLHHVFLKSDLVTGLVTLGVCLQLPVDGVDLILGNDLAGGQVFLVLLLYMNHQQLEFLSLILSSLLYSLFVL